MAVWHLVAAEVTRPHVSYAVIGFALLLFGTTSLILKEKLYIGEATVATIYGLIVGPHCLNWFAPTTWGNTDYITMELSRLVLIVQIFAVAVELPKKYMLRHWWSVGMLLVPVMTFGWVVSSVFIWKLIPSLRWIEALCIAGCVTATDPVLASAVVGKGKFARRVPGHLRNLLSAESACNDGMAFPFVMLAVAILREEHHPGEIAREFVGIIVFYGCVLGILIGIVIGYGTRHLIKFAEKHRMIDRESFLVYYFCVAIFCMGVGTLTGVDDLLVAFAAGAAFSWDGWFAKQTENAHVSNVIDVLLNTAFFVYFGAVVPWPQFNDEQLGIRAWKLVIIAIIILVVRRLPIMLALKPIIPDIKTWREAIFSGHFGPIGVGGLFMALLARAEIINDSETPAAQLPPKDHPHHYVVACIWPVTCFLVIASIIVHGSSVAVFTLGKHLNNMAITMTYTTGGNNPSWMSRLPSRFGEGNNSSLQLQKVDTEMPIGLRLTRRKAKARRSQASSSDQDNATLGDQDHNTNQGLRASSDKLSESDGHGSSRLANSTGLHDEAPDKIPVDLTLETAENGLIKRTEMIPAADLLGKSPQKLRAYREDSKILIEDDNGNVVHTFDIPQTHGEIIGHPQLKVHAEALDENNMIMLQAHAPSNTLRVSQNKNSKRQRRASSVHSSGRLSRSASIVRLPGSDGRRVAYAYQTDDGVVLENEDGEIIRRYKFIPRGSAPELPLRRRKGLVGWFVRHWPLGHEVSSDNGSDSAAHSSVGDFNSLRKESLRTGDGESSPGETYPDVEHTPEDMLVPIPEDRTQDNHAATLSTEQEQAVRTQLSTLLRSGQLSHRQGLNGNGSTPPSSSNQRLSLANRDRYVKPEEDNGVTDEEEEEEEGEGDGARYDYDDENEEPETEVERARRLAALGVISSDRDREDETDGLHASIPAEPAPAATRDTNIGQAEDDEPRITFQLPRRPDQ